jgi:RNA polymerase sigma factor (sigma-70 family)
VNAEGSGAVGRSQASRDRRDAELYRRAASGDSGAFEELYRRYSSPAYSLAFRLTGGKQLAQEVVHDSFLAVWSSPHLFDPTRAAFRTFFLLVVHHRAVDVVRREERLRQLLARVNPVPVADEDVAEGVVQEAWVAGWRDRVLAALRELSPDQRRVLELAYFQGLTQARIAKELGIPLGTVKTRTLAGLRKLHRLLGEGEG